MALRRIETLCTHLTHSIDESESVSAGPAAAAAGAGSGAPREVVITDACRTPIGKARRGAFKDTTPDVLLGTVLAATVKRSGIKPSDVQDICVGNVLQPGSGAAMARMAQLCVGFSADTPLSTVNRQCSSGLQAAMNVAAAISMGHIDVGIGAGVESMSLNSMADSAPDVDWSKVGESAAAQACMTPMGMTSENVAARFGVSREQQDAMAVTSHARAAAAQDRGAFDAEIVPVTVSSDDGDIVVKADEGVRRGTTAAKLAKLRPAFKADGTTTAGNSSQVSDGAAAVTLMSRDKATELGAPVIGVVKSYAVVGVDPDIMGIGPAVAIPAALEKAGLAVADIDLFEINEAFASQATYCVDKLGIGMEKVNVNGGAIALGHPLGCTGARQIATLLFELKRRGKKYGVVSMCIGTGMGAAAVLEAV